MPVTWVKAITVAKSRAPSYRAGLVNAKPATVAVPLPSTATVWLPPQETSENQRPRWQEIDPHTGVPYCLVRIVVRDSELQELGERHKVLPGMSADGW